MNARYKMISLSLGYAILTGVAGAQDTGQLENADSQLAATAITNIAPDAVNSRRPRRLSDAMAGSASSEWSPSLNSVSRVEAPLERALREGEAALAGGNLLDPAAGALGRFRAALTLDAANATALAGIERVAAALLEKARSAHAAGERQTARNWLDQLAVIRPAYAGTQDLRDQLARDQHLGELFALAAVHMETNRLLGNDGNNAVTSYRAILDLDPENGIALEGLARVEGLLLAEVTAAVQAGQMEAAQRRLQLASQVRGRSDAISAAEEQIAMARQQRFEEQRSTVVTLIAEGEFSLAEASLEQLADSGYRGRMDDLGAQIEEGQRLLAYVPGAPLPAPELSAQDPLLELVIVGQGEFTMGSPLAEAGRHEREGPTRKIRIARPFAITKTEISVASFGQFVEATGYLTDAEKSGTSEIFDVSSGSLQDKDGVNWRHDFRGRRAKGHLPALRVSYNDAVAYAAWITNLTGKNYRLPSESEFEYALRAGSASRFWWGDGSPPRRLENLTGERDNFSGLEWPDAFDRYGDNHWGPAPVGKFESNPFGLYDMGGNVAEWVADCFNPGLANTPDNGAPSKVGECELRVVRGASWANPPATARSAYRTAAAPERTSALIGFRLVREL